MNSVNKFKNKKSNWMVALTFVAAMTGFSGTSLAADKWIAGFYPLWVAQNFPPEKIDFKSITHVMVFSVFPEKDGNLDVSNVDGAGGEVAKLVAKLAHDNGRKALLTIGGAGEKTGPGFLAATSEWETLDRLANNIIRVAEGLGMDGVDLDWEPFSSDRVTAAHYKGYYNLVYRIRELRPNMIITVDLMTFNRNFAMTDDAKWFFKGLSALVDQMNVMTYDMAQTAPGWVLTHNSPLYGDADNHPTSVKSTIDMYLSVGVPAAKLGIGIGFYGNCWNNGAQWPHEEFKASKMVCGDGDMSYANIMKEYYNDNDYKYDPTTQNPFLTMLAPRGKCQCTLITYEDEVSIAAKANFVHEYGLGGTIIWQMEEGYLNGDQKLLRSVANSFWKRAPETSANLCRNYIEWNSTKAYPFGHVVKFANKYFTTYRDGVPGLIPNVSTHYWKPYEPCN